jgi:hypothetical protein
VRRAEPPDRSVTEVFHGFRGREASLHTSQHLVLTLMMSGLILLLSLYDVMKSTGTDFIIPCILPDLCK